MEWVTSNFSFRSKPFSVVHFDVHPDMIDRSIEGVDDILVWHNSESFDAPVEWDNSSGEIGAVLWKDAMVWFLRYLADYKPEGWKRKKVLELGAGCGVVGLALAADGAHVYLTDVECLTPMLEENVKANPYNCKAETCDWLLEKAPDDDFHIVIMAEVLYGDRCVWPGLKQVLLDASSHSAFEEALLAVNLRVGRQDIDDFLALVGDVFHYQRVACYKGKAEADFGVEIYSFTCR
eukprot:GEMP01039957.1.p1 GENE.GEMP01039957.1~~GEMP01039957.1.p1  ORF type:complete len:235 (+),score=27.90 GEMP01039957.1:264-968(+)